LKQCIDHILCIYVFVHVYDNNHAAALIKKQISGCTTLVVVVISFYFSEVRSNISVYGFIEATDSLTFLIIHSRFSFFFLALRGGEVQPFCRRTHRGDRIGLPVVQPR
jgi:hypothetical protein